MLPASGYVYFTTTTLSAASTLMFTAYSSFCIALMGLTATVPMIADIQDNS